MVEGDHITPEIERMIRDYRVGGVVLFRWAGNLESRKQIAQLTGELQSLSMRETGAPLFISIDQEGGIVTRIPGATDFPGIWPLVQQEAQSMHMMWAE